MFVCVYVYSLIILNNFLLSTANTFSKYCKWDWDGSDNNNGFRVIVEACDVYAIRQNWHFWFQYNIHAHISEEV